jgi:hypothetical protein
VPAVAPLILGGAAIAAIAVASKQNEASVVTAVRDHDRVASAEMLLRAWMDNHGVRQKAYQNDPWPSRPGVGAAAGEAQGDPDDPVFRAGLTLFQKWANDNGFAFKPAGATQAQTLHTDGMLDTATFGVLSAQSALSDPKPMTSTATPSPAAFVPYQPGTAYYIAYAPGALEHVMDSWEPTVLSVATPGGMVPAKMIFDPTHPDPPPSPPPPASAPAAWIAALHAGRVIAIATYHGHPNAPASPAVEVFAVYPGPQAAPIVAAPPPGRGPTPPPPNAPTPPPALPMPPPTAATGYAWPGPVVFDRWPGPWEYGAYFVHNSWPGYHGYGHGEMSPWHRW